MAVQALIIDGILNIQKNSIIIRKQRCTFVSMNVIAKVCLLVLFCVVGGNSFAQQSTLRKYKRAVTSKEIKLDSLSIYPNSFQVFCGKEALRKEAFLIDFASAKFQLLEACADTLYFEYRVFPIDLTKVYQRRDTSVIYDEKKGSYEQFLITSKDVYGDIFGNTGLQKNGSISRGVSFGNNQDLSVNSTLNLELSGDIAPNLKLLASVSDDNLPIQPDGNTNKLQEFDQVFIQVYNDKFKLIAGDFWIQKPQGYFMNYKKRAQGIYGEFGYKPSEKQEWKFQGSAALSKGKFARQIIQGIEGNQGPYRLRGNENEPFIIILSGTERVYIDGRLLQRGQEFDYVVNYNTSEVTFTTRNLITKDVRIVVEFQYSDQNYARSLVQGSTAYSSEKFNFWLNAYSEQDAKNQTIQQSLTLPQRQLLSEIGDSLELARTNSIDSVGFQENQNVYKMVDSLFTDSVLVYSINPDSAYFSATFTFVGASKGNYVFSKYNALGKVYKWVAPVAGIPQGDYEPARIIITPKQKQMVSAGFSYKIRPKLTVESEWAYTKNDLNTFSKKDSGNDQGVSNKTRLLGLVPLSRDSAKTWLLNTKAEIEMLQRNFAPIEQYRAVEFDRDWNTRNKGYTGNQFNSNLTADFKHKKYGNLAIEASHFSIGNEYAGLKSRLFGQWNQKGFRANWDGSYLMSDAVDKNQFLRHKVDVSQSFKNIRIGFKDDQERNEYNKGQLLSLQSYQFMDYEFYVASADSSKFNYRLFYRERYDGKSDSSRLINVAKARNVGGEIKLIGGQTQKLNILVNYRELKINQPTLISQSPENTLLGRIDYELKLFKSAITWNTYYEIGSGLELRKEFQYIKVADGQGVYTWIDYNGDGIKDLNEFEIAQFVDQAGYIRVFTPSNEYLKTYSNELNQGVFIKPERIWVNKKGALGVLSRFSDQARVRVNRKTNTFNSDSFNPFAAEVRDTTLISTNSNVRNTLYFNRTNSIFGAEYVVQDVRSKTLLASGFDARLNSYQEGSFRWNIIKIFAIESTVQWGRKSVNADYTTGRNYDLKYYFVKPSFSYQPSTSFRLTLETRISNKLNVEGEKADVKELGLKLKFNQAEKGSLQAAVAMVDIKYDGNPGTSLGFEMLESLKPGKNFTWNAGYQRSISKSLQISIQYNGRKSETNKTIHSGGMEVRAFF